MKIRGTLFCLLSAAAVALTADPALALSEKKEIEIGAEMHAEILAKMPIYPDVLLQEYVDSVGQALARVSGRPGLEYTFTIIDSPDIISSSHRS